MTRPWIVALALCGLAGQALAADEVPTKPTNPSSRRLDDGGFELAYPYWLPEGHGAPTALLARYVWNGQPERVASARLDKHDSTLPRDWKWIFEFTDQPKPEELARVDLLYQFELTDKDRAEIAEAARKLAESLVLAFGEANDAARKDDAALAREVEKRTLEVAKTPEARTLLKFGDQDGKDGLGLFLETLGFEQLPSGGWRATDDARLRMVALSDKLLRTLPPDDRDKAARTRHLGALAKAKVDPQDPCAQAAKDGSELAHDVKLAGRVVKVCGEKLLQALNDLAAKQEGDVKAKTTAAAQVVEGAVKNRTRTDSPLLLNLANVATDRDTIASSYAYHALAVAQNTLKDPGANSDWVIARELLVKDVTVAIERASLVEPGSTLIAGGLKPRRYDIATGAVFVTGLQDLVLPTVIAVCGWEGCLRQNEVWWDAHNGFVRSLSLDAGIRVKTLDTQDPRQSDKLSFLFGLSWNPVSVLRLSAGGYAFENAQTRNWNLVPYVGVTFNVLNAAELLGGLGLGPQFAPTPIDTK
jgi:hypothetical protein